MSWHWDDPGGTGLPDGLRLDDEALGAELTDALAEDELFRAVAAAGRWAFATHRGLLALNDEVDADLLLLELVHDSAGDDDLVALRDRSGEQPRTLLFEGDGVGVELEVTDDGVEGQLIPARPGRVTLRGPDGDIATATTYDVGYFRLAQVPSGPVRLVCEGESGVCVTQWLAW